MFTDGMSPTYMVEEARAKAGSFESTWGLLMSLPYRALHPDRVLVLGAGAGASVWLAKKYGASRVDAVEVNPAIPGLLARWKHFAGDVYHQPGVRLFIEDARRYLADTAERYDLIELALALTGNAHAQPAGMEATLYTVEAVQLYLRHLTPTGVLVLIHSDPGNAYRQLLTVLEALERSASVAHARSKESSSCTIHGPERPTATCWSCGPRRCRWRWPTASTSTRRSCLWGPGDPPERRRPAARSGASSAPRADDDLTPVHDERPYFFQNTKGLRATALAEPGRLWVLAGAILLVLVLIVERRRDARSFLRPAAVADRPRRRVSVRRARARSSGSRSRPAARCMRVSFVLFSLLAWSAAGALWLGGRWRRLERGVSWACLAAGLAVAATALRRARPRVARRGLE